MLAAALDYKDPRLRVDERQNDEQHDDFAAFFRLHEEKKPRVQILSAVYTYVPTTLYTQLDLRVKKY